MNIWSFRRFRGLRALVGTVLGHEEGEHRAQLPQPLRLVFGENRQRDVVRGRVEGDLHQHPDLVVVRQVDRQLLRQKFT